MDEAYLATNRCKRQRPVAYSSSYGV